MRKLLIVGASGHGRVVADIAIALGKYEAIAFADDDTSITECMGFPVIGQISDLNRFVSEYEYFVAIGNVAHRSRISTAIKEINGILATLIHPQAVVSSYATIGDGCAVMPGAVINAGAQIGTGCIINTCASVDHDCRLDDYVHVAVGAHLAGAVSVGYGTWIGAGAVIRNNIDICGQCMIGAGAVVVKNITQSGTYVGVPARKIHE